MTSQYVRGVKDKWHITRKQIGFCISPEMGQVLWPAPFPAYLIFRRSVYAKGYPAWRSVLCRPEPGGRLRARRHPPCPCYPNDVGNHFSPTVVAAAITSRKAKNSLPTHILLENVPGLAPTSLLLLEQLRTIDRKRLRGYIGRISKEKCWR